MPDIPWSGPIVREGIRTGDGRLIHENALTWGEPPFPLEWVRMSDEVPHGNKVVVGMISTLERQPVEDHHVLHGRGVLFDQPEQEEVANLLRNKVIGPSVDLDGPFEVEIVMVMPDFDEEPETNDDGEETVTIKPKPDQTDFYAATVRGATLVSIPAFAELQWELGEAEAVAVAASITAASMPAPPMTPPVEWFRDPALEEVTPITVLDSGRVYGHVAGWADCHTAYDVCVSPPHSTSGYAYFMTGEVLCDAGERIPVGQITISTGHAPMRMGAKAAASHYDNTGSVVADVAVGEDRHGLWIAGSLRPGVTDEMVRALMCSDVSGDWRPLRGGLELIGVLAVNVPGFPKSRVAARVASGAVETLVASAGPVLHQVGPPLDTKRLAARVAASVGHDTWQAERSNAARERLVALKG